MDYTPLDWQLDTVSALNTAADVAGCSTTAMADEWDNQCEEA